MIKDLLKIANHLDSKGLTKEADYLDSIIKKIAAGMDGDLTQLGWEGDGLHDWEDYSPRDPDLTIDDVIEMNSIEEDEVRQNQDDTEEALSLLLHDYFDKDESGAIDPDESLDIGELFMAIISAYAEKHGLSKEDAEKFVAEELAYLVNGSMKIDFSGQRTFRSRNKVSE